MPERDEAEQRELVKMGFSPSATHGQHGAGVLIRVAAEVGVAAARPFAVYHMEAIQPYL